MTCKGKVTIMEKISFVILTWNSEQTIAKCLEGIWGKCTHENIDFEIFVVDNGSKDGTVDIIKRNFDKNPIKLIQLPKNFGTTKPRNIALKQCSGDVICVLDSDAVILEGSLRTIGVMLVKDDSIGILAPKLIFSDGTTQESVRKFPSVFGKFSKIFGIIFKLKFRDIDGYKYFPFSQTTEVDYAISACWFFRRKLIHDVGFLDENIFYSPEDVDYGIRVWKKGKKTIYYPDFTVLHYVQRLTHKKIFSRIALSHLFGVIYYFYKHRYFKKPSKI